MNITNIDTDPTMAKIIAKTEVGSNSDILFNHSIIAFVLLLGTLN